MHRKNVGTKTIDTEIQTRWIGKTIYKVRNTLCMDMTNSGKQNKTTNINTETHSE